VARHRLKITGRISRPAYGARLTIRNYGGLGLWELSSFVIE